MTHDNKSLAVNQNLKQSFPDSRTFLEYKTPFEGTEKEGFQGTWVELTTFIGNGTDKRRFDFSFPTKLWQDLAVEEVVTLVERAARLEKL